VLVVVIVISIVVAFSAMSFSAMSFAIVSLATISLAFALGWCAWSWRARCGGAWCFCCRAVIASALALMHWRLIATDLWAVFDLDAARQSEQQEERGRV
jgi:hypothetical protein